jgi:uncharacterized protein (TIGR02217 family)
MALAVLSASYVPLHPYDYGDERPSVVARMSGGAEQRAASLSRKLRTYTLRFRTTAATRLALDTFFEARGYTVESFLWKDLKDYTRTGVAIGTGDGATTAFVLPKTGTYGGDYPLTSGVQLYSAGSPVAGSATTDTRTLTYNAAPAGAAALTADYSFYKRVRLLDRFTWSEPVFGVFETVLVLVEVPST